MNLHGLVSLIREATSYRKLLDELTSVKSEVVTVILEAGRPYLASALHQDMKLPMLIIVPSPEMAKKFYDELNIWCDEQVQVMLYPESDVLPYETISPDPFKEQQRLQVMASLKKSETASPIVIAPAIAVIRKTISAAEFIDSCHTLKEGMHVDPLDLLRKWSSLGYQRENLVQVPGTMCQRGGILDIYPPGNDLPARIEFFGNEIESIRLFDPQNQRSLQTVPLITIIPAQETASSGTIIDYFLSDSLVFISEPAEIKACISEMVAQAEELKGSQIDNNNLQKISISPYLTHIELEEKLARIHRHLIATRWASGDDIVTYLPFSSAGNYVGKLQILLEDIKRLIVEGRRVIITSYQASRLSKLLEEENILSTPVSNLEYPVPPGSITLIQGSLPEGWIMGENTVVITDAEIFGFVKQRRMLKKRPVNNLSLLPDLSPGDYAVHTDHGVARFAGMTRKRLDEVEKEYLILEYAAGDRIYVPSDQADRVSRYLGSGDAPTLTRLGTHEWARLKQKVELSTREMAQELISLYASREITPAFAFSPDTPWQQDLEASFPYVETRDQETAVRQVKDDMEKPEPLDRLICGDVGYGKTEVALRAAFKAVMDGKQVAMLVPTTVLAQQHFTTFTQRLAAFPVKVEMLSRFRSEKEQHNIIKSVADGSVDICIGTHRLLQKDVKFNDLGLVIIDEEQRFGVAHKERLKQMRKEVDVLTLSATPIPRTLHLSLVGVRDMSTMETPPEERSPIKTQVSQYSESIVHEAIIREIGRNGQVFFVHNRVQSIERMARKLRELLPEAEIAVGHGQMNEEELEKAMLDFTQGKTDVLVCTTIIESGLDIPNANTLIINDADRFGLAQLYQLRGRVGRGSNRAYAYFLYSKGKRLTPAAVKRLQTIFEATELGAGFRIAMKDLEIRGAGNLLGREQSGHIAAVGFDLYCQLLAEAVDAEKAKQSGLNGNNALSKKLTPIIIDLPLPAYIPEDYVVDPGTRLVLYQKLAKLHTTEDVEETAGEFRDRFGNPPVVVDNLLYIVNIKAMAAKANIESIIREEGKIVLRLRKGIEIDRQEMERNWPGLKAGHSQLIVNMQKLGDKWYWVLEGVVGELMQHNHDKPREKD